MMRFTQLPRLALALGLMAFGASLAPDRAWAENDYEFGLSLMAKDKEGNFRAEDLVDRVEWFRAPMVMGGDGVPAIQPFGVDRLAGAPRFRRTNMRFPGVDLLESLSRDD